MTTPSPTETLLQPLTEMPFVSYYLAAFWLLYPAAQEQILQ